MADFIAMAKLARLTASERVGVTSDAQHQTVVASRCHRAHPHALECLDDPWRELVLTVAVPKLAKEPVAKREHLAAAAQHQARLNDLRRRFGDGVAVPEAPARAGAKRVDEAVDAQHKAVVPSRRHRAHPHAPQCLDGPRCSVAKPASS
eukprot:4858076-Prymnesium_polylepis.1